MVRAPPASTCMPARLRRSGRFGSELSPMRAVGLRAPVRPPNASTALQGTRLIRMRRMSSAGVAGLLRGASVSPQLCRVSGL